MNYVIRDARTDEVDEIVDILLMPHQHTIELYMNTKVDIPKAKMNLRFLTTYEKGILIIAIDGNTIIGVINGSVIENWFNDDVYSQDQILFVHPDYRQHRIGLKLLDAFQKKSLELGATRIVTGVSFDNFNMYKVGRMLQKRGYKLVSELYQKDF
jgi:GNAT superfamily N-acetyltransferase